MLVLRFSGVLTGIDTPDTLVSMQICWMLSGVDSTESDAIANGRSLTWYATTNSTEITDFLSTGVYTLMSPLIGTITPAIRVTERRNGGAEITGNWTHASSVVVPDESLPTAITVTLSNKTVSFTGGSGVTLFYTSDGTTPTTNSPHMQLHTTSFVHNDMTSNYKYVLASVTSAGAFTAPTSVYTPA